MTTRELLNSLAQAQTLTTLVLVGPMLLALLLGLLHPRGLGRRAPFKYGYSLAVYGACAPGVLAAVLDGYVLFFSRENLLDMSALITLAPLVAMVATLGLVRRNVEFSDLPGFDRLSGLVILLFVTGVSVIALSKLRLVVLFHGSIWMLLGLGVAIFLALKFGAHLLFRRKAPRYD